MNALFVIVLGSLCLVTFSFCEGGRSQKAVQPPVARTGDGIPLACNRNALTPAQRKRHFEELGPALHSLVKSIRELPDGYEFEFAPDWSTLQDMAEWTAGERLCCPFLDIDIRADTGQGSVWLRLTGGDGTKQLIRAERWFMQ
jgi:hypothetical protein